MHCTQDINLEKKKNLSGLSHNKVALLFYSGRKLMTTVVQKDKDWGEGHMNKETSLIYNYVFSSRIHLTME